MALHLTPRLQTVADRVPAGARLADVGTDHAYLPTWLLMNGKIPFAVCTDLRPGPLERAKETVEQACAVHGIPYEEVLAKLNELVKE